MKHYVIFDRENGHLQWSGQYSTDLEAVKHFDDIVGINPDGLSIEDLAGTLDIKEVTEEQRIACELWWENGAKSDEFPLPDIF